MRRAAPVLALAPRLCIAVSSKNSLGLASPTLSRRSDGSGRLRRKTRMASPPGNEFARLTRLPPYVFNITTELKMAARRRGEDIIDFGMGNPDGPTPKHIVDKLIETVVPARHARLLGVEGDSRGCAARSAIGTRAATASSSTRRAKRSRRSARRRASRTSRSRRSAAATRCSCRTRAIRSTSTVR